MQGYKIVMVFRLKESERAGRLVARKYAAAKQTFSMMSITCSRHRMNSLLLTTSPFFEGVVDFDT